jgi:hypothetical protein
MAIYRQGVATKKPRVNTISANKNPVMKRERLDVIGDKLMNRGQQLIRAADSGRGSNPDRMRVVGERMFNSGREALQGRITQDAMRAYKSGINAAEKARDTARVNAAASRATSAASGLLRRFVPAVGGVMLAAEVVRLAMAASRTDKNGATAESGKQQYSGAGGIHPSRAPLVDGQVLVQKADGSTFIRKQKVSQAYVSSV